MLGDVQLWYITYYVLLKKNYKKYFPTYFQDFLVIVCNAYYCISNYKKICKLAADDQNQDLYTQILFKKL